MRPWAFRAALMGEPSPRPRSPAPPRPRRLPSGFEYFRAPSAASLGTSIRISEIHYDNASTGAGEAIGISGPGGTSLAGWSIVLSNGANSLSYGTRALTSTIATSCGERGVVFETYAPNGPATGIASTDIGITEPGTTPVG